MWPPDLWELDVSSLPLPESCQVSLVLSCWLLQKQLGMLYCQCVGVRHMIQDCVQTVLYMLQCVLRVGLAGLVILDQIIVGLCGLVGCCSQLLCRLHSQSGGFGSLETALPTKV